MLITVAAGTEEKHNQPNLFLVNTNVTVAKNSFDRSEQKIHKQHTTGLIPFLRSARDLSDTFV